MTPDEQRTYWREKQREFRAKRKGMNAAAVKASQAAAETLRLSRPRYVPPPLPAITASVSCRASMEEIAALGPVRARAFLVGVGEIMSVVAASQRVGAE